MIRQNNNYFDSISTTMERSPGFFIWIGFLAALIILGGYALLMSLIDSMEILESSHHIPWGLTISTYVFLVGSSIGLCMVSSLGFVFGLKRYELIGKRCVFLALIAIVFGLLSISLHLGHPERGAIYNALTPNFRSAMWWMGTLYPPYIVFIAIWFWLLARADLSGIADQSEGLKAKIYRLLALDRLKPFLYERLSFEKIESWVYRRLPLERMGLALNAPGADLRWARILGTMAFIFGLMAYTVEGSLFAHVEMRPFWYGALYPIDFLLGAALCGFAWLMATVIITYAVKGQKLPENLETLFYEMAEVLALLLSLECLFITYKMGHGLFEPAKAKTIVLFLTGPFSFAFWVFEITIGLIMPIFILLYGSKKKKPAAVLAGSVMALIGYFVKRYDFVVASQVYPIIKAEHPLSSYLPTFIETLLIGGIIAAFLLAYTLGVKFLPLKEGEFIQTK